jgi:hypothetical protein
MVVKTEPIPYMKTAFHYGARTDREQALFKGLDASSRQAEMNKAHTGGAMTVPQFHTGMTHGAVNPNALSASLNKALTQHAANSEFDKLALVVKKGGRKKKAKKAKKTVKKGKKAKKTRRHTRRN